MTERYLENFPNAITDHAKAESMAYAADEAESLVTGAKKELIDDFDALNIDDNIDQEHFDVREKAIEDAISLANSIHDQAAADYDYQQGN